MAGKTIIEAALNGPPGSNVSYFFRGDQYVTYDWVQDRVTLGLKSISDDWTLSGGWTGIGSPRIDAALSGHEVNQPDYATKHYFFNHFEYAKYDWGVTKPRAIENASTGAAWHWPPELSDGVDAAVTGKYSRQGKSYFLKGNKYARYDWGQDRLDYVKTIDQMAPGTFPPGFTSDIDAIVNGEGAYADYAYFFKGDRYIRFDWDNGGQTPFVDGTPRPISAWPGLHEMLLAGEAKSKAFEWVWTALPQLQTYVASIRAGISPANAETMVTALQTHFRLSTAETADIALLDPILLNLDKIEKYLHRAPNLFKFSTYDQCIADEMVEFQKDASGNFVLDASGKKIAVRDGAGNPVLLGKAYTGFNAGTSITPDFPKAGEACRAAQIIHEAGHFVDSNANTANDIPEWYVTQPTATALNLTFQANRPEISARYNEMTATQAQHNPSSYAAFCQHLRYLSDTRYGELRQNPLPGLY